MTKTELMENYTAEQLADMVLYGEQIGEKLMDVITGGNKEIPVIFDKISRAETKGLEGENHKKTLIEKYQEELDEWKKNHPYNIDERLEAQKLIKEIRRDENGIWLNLEDSDFIQNYSKMQKAISDNQVTINELNCKVEKYRKAFEDAKKERDCQIAEYQKKIKEMADRAILEFPTEPIDVANFLINGLGASWHYDSFGVSELRQIAEHLLVYCNHNKEEEE